jgi:hypothetical protein
MCEKGISRQEIGELLRVGDIGGVAVTEMQA